MFYCTRQWVSHELLCSAAFQSFQSLFCRYSTYGKYQTHLPYFCFAGNQSPAEYCGQGRHREGESRPYLSQVHSPDHAASDSHLPPFCHKFSIDIKILPHRTVRHLLKDRGGGCGQYCRSWSPELKILLFLQSQFSLLLTV